MSGRKSRDKGARTERAVAKLLGARKVSRAWMSGHEAECGTTATKLIEGIVIAKNPHRPLSSALRVYIAGYFHGSAPRCGLVDPSSRLAFRLEKSSKSRKKPKQPSASA